MDNKRLFISIVSILIVLVVPFIILIYNFNSIAFNQDLYRKEFSKHNVYDNLKEYNIENINNDVLTYLKFKKNNILIKNYFFNVREKTHLLDVKNLIQAIFNIYYFIIILIILLIIILIVLLNFNIRKIVKRLLIIIAIGSLFTLLYAVAIFLLSNFNFDSVFDLFHKTFFISGTFTFNPEFENIVVLYPENLFFNFLVKIILNTILSSITLLFFSVLFIFIFFKSNFYKFFLKISTEYIKNRKI